MLAWAVQHFSDCHAHAQLGSVYFPSTARAGDVISEPRLPPALAQFTSGGRREPGDEASLAASAMSQITQVCHIKGSTDPPCLDFAVYTAVCGRYTMCYIPPGYKT